MSITIKLNIESLHNTTAQIDIVADILDNLGKTKVINEQSKVNLILNFTNSRLSGKVSGSDDKVERTQYAINLDEYMSYILRPILHKNYVKHSTTVRVFAPLLKDYEHTSFNKDFNYVINNVNINETVSIKDSIEIFKDGIKLNDINTPLVEVFAIGLSL